ncbi:hypothetical protein [Halostella litorea]|uniref:hypothetical protein n=1 Tax=Halostella litorea TaxID=2528831 RepID=UPI0010929D5E|nr:hypothetical protein [Halostella litorea]
MHDQDTEIDRTNLRPTETECNHTAERALKLLWENPDTKAVRIDSNPNPMYVTVEDGDLAFWAFDYTWKCQERVPVPDAYGPFETVVDQLHGYANDDYPIGTVSKDRIDTEPRPKPTSLEDFA